MHHLCIFMQHLYMYFNRFISIIKDGRQTVVVDFGQMKPTVKRALCPFGVGCIILTPCFACHLVVIKCTMTSIDRFHTLKSLIWFLVAAE